MALWSKGRYQPKASPWVCEISMILCGLKGRVNPHHATIIIAHPGSLIFSTKDRVPVTPAIRSELHPYLAVVLRDNDCPSLRVGGAADHVHLFLRPGADIASREVVEIVKTSPQVD